MRKLGYLILFLLLITIIIPSILVKGCAHKKEPAKSKKEIVVPKKISVYIHNEDKVEEMDFEEYIKGVVSAEMPASFHVEALKAQAVAARTYAYHRIRNIEDSGIKPQEHKGADTCTDPAHCKAWIAKKHAMDRWGIMSARTYWNKIDKAVEDTKGLIMTYENEPIDAVFHSTSSGKTENSEEVWSNIIPYLRSTDSVGDERSPKFTSTIKVPEQNFRTALKKQTPQINLDGDINSLIGPIQRTEGGSVKVIKIGNLDIKGTDIRKVFGLNSANFTINVEDNMLVFSVKGNGHGVGMSQYGADSLANEGKDFKTILLHYYKDINIVPSPYVKFK